MSVDRLEILQKMMKDKPEDLFLQYAIALEYKSAGSYEPAKEQLDRLLQTSPDYLPTYYQLAELLEETGEIERAAAVLEKGMALAQRLGDSRTARELKQAYDLLGE